MRPLVVELLAGWLGPWAQLLVPGYLFCLGLGSLLAAAWMVDAAARAGYAKSDALGVLFAAYACGLLGAAAVPVAQALGGLAVEHRLALRTGLAAYGGLLGGAAGAAWALGRRGLAVWPFLDAAAPGLGLGYFFARLGCFLAGCDYGKVTAAPFAVRFPPGSFAFRDQVSAGLLDPGASASLAVHPTQLYLAFAGLFLFCVVGAMPPRPDGRRLVAYFVGYGLLRSLIEALRGDESRGHVGPLSTSQLLALVSTAALVAVYARGVVRSPGETPRP